MPFAQEIFDSPEPGPRLPARDFPEHRQWDFTMRLLRDLGFDLEAGRQDRSAHPFTSGTSPDDVRLTTRFLPGDPRSSIMATIHEAGHGMYEQGLARPTDLVRHVRRPGRLARACTSRSRGCGRTRSAARGRSGSTTTPVSSAASPAPSPTWTSTDCRARSTWCEPSLIRVEADEVTYNLHILLRFELELALIRGDLAVADLPDGLERGHARYLGIDAAAPTATACLQDVHWSGGSIGYFPTYTLGNLYAAQLYEAARKAIPDLDEQIGAGEFGPCSSGCGEKIHRQGHLGTPRRSPARPPARASSTPR